MSARRRRFDRVLVGALLLLVGIVALAYAPGLKNGFVWLDHREIEEGALIAKSPGEAWALFVRDRNYVGYYRPLYDLTHSLNLALWGLEPFGFHLTSLVLHLLCAALVFAIALELGKPVFWGGLLAALWGVHPVNTAVVGLIHAVADLVVTTFLLAATLFAIRSMREESRRPWNSILMWVCFTCALFAKETAVVFPIFLLFLFGGRLRFHWGGLLACGVSAILYGFHRISGLSSNAYASPLGLGERILTFATTYPEYVAKIFWPGNLSECDTVTRFSAMARSEQIQGLALFGIVVIGEALVALRWKSTRGWLLAHALSLLPVAQLVPILHFRADRFLFLPSLGLLGAALEVAAIGARAAAAGGRTWVRNALVGVGLLGLAAECLLVRARVADFADDRSLFLPEIVSTPDYLEGLSVLAKSCDDSKRFEESDGYYGRIFREYPGRISFVEWDTVVLNRSAQLLARNEAKAALEFLRAQDWRVTLSRQREEIAYNSGVAHFKLREYGEALKRLLPYTAQHPNEPRAHLLAGLSAFEMGNWPVAETELDAFLRLDPSSPERPVVLRCLSEVRQRTR